MNQSHKNQLILLIWLAVKLLVTTRYFYDTFTVALGEGTPVAIAVLDGVLIDGVFAALWIVLSFGGQSQAMLAVRPFAAVGAWLLYGLMLRVAETNGTVALLARVAGGLGLAYDTLDIALTWLRRVQAALAERWQALRRERRAVTLPARRAQQRAQVWHAAYGFALLLLRPVVWFASGALVLGDLYHDARAAWASAQSQAQHAYATVTSQPLVQAGPTSLVRYEEHASGMWVSICDVCDWRSNPAAARTHAARAYSAHTRGKQHRASLTSEVH